MILDALSVFDLAKAVTVTAPSTNTLDLVHKRDIGPGEDLYISVGVSQPFLGTGTTTLTIEAQGSVDNMTWYTISSSPAYAEADLIAGAQLFQTDWPTLASFQPTPRYIRLNYVVTNGPFAAGSLNAMIVLDRQNFEPVRYGNNYEVAV